MENSIVYKRNSTGYQDIGIFKYEKTKKERNIGIKRIQDIILSLIALIILSPVMLIIIVLIVIDDPQGSPIFSQTRCGKNGTLFKLYKFRSMHVNAEKELGELLGYNETAGIAFKMKNDPRVTKVGKFLRKSGLDELPQFWNVLRGEMSIVGPRPALPVEVEQYNAYHKQRMEAIPGLTCYWQIQPKRNLVSFDEWVEMDIRYIQEQSFGVDWKIIVLTMGAIIRGEGM